MDVADPMLDLEPGKAQRAAAEFCQQAVEAEQEVATNTQLVDCKADTITINVPAGTFYAVEVETQVRLDAILMGMIGRHELSSSGSAVARPVSGISEADSGKQPTAEPPSVEPPSDDGPPPSTAPPKPPEEEIEPCDPDDDDNGDDDGGNDDGDDEGDDDGDDDGDDLEPCETPKPGS